MSEETPEPRRRLDLDWVKVVAGALAAVSSAVLLSTLGSVGTVAGAALGSVIVTITSSLYSSGLAKGTEKVAAAQTVALRKVTAATEQIQQVREQTQDEPTGATGSARTDDGEATSGAAQTDDEALEAAEEKLDEAAEELERAVEEPVARPGLRERLAGLPYKRIALAAAGLFLVAMLLVTAFELIGGRSLSSYTERDGGSSGTSIGGLLGGGGQDDTDEPEAPLTPTDEPSSPAPGTPTTTDDGATDAPSPADPTTRDPGATDPTDDQTTDDPAETDEPSTSPSPTTTPTPGPTRTPSPTG